MKAILIVLSTALAIAAISELGTAFAEQASTPIAAVSPKIGSPRTHFAVSFRPPANRPSTTARYELKASVGSRRGCMSTAFGSAPASGGGGEVRVTLTPPGISDWCPGTYHGEVQEVAGPPCPPRELCPNYIAIVTIDQFTFHVRRPPIRPYSAAIKFAGLRALSTVCSGGQPGSGQTTSYRLSWTAATDRSTPSSRIVYEVYASDTAGGEDFSTPTWTTRPGVIAFATPQVPVGSYHFVVRARDQLGREDRNRVERRGSGGCAHPGAIG